jgi:hypothetical protein
MDTINFTRTRRASGVTDREAKDRRVFGDEKIDQSAFANTSRSADDERRWAMKERRRKSSGGRGCGGDQTARGMSDGGSDRFHDLIP